jgi:hypothetical protein
MVLDVCGYMSLAQCDTPHRYLPQNLRDLQGEARF